MVSVLAAAWRMILQRTRADWLILAAATLIILLATTLLSAGPIYAGAVAVSGLHRTLHDAPVPDGNVEINARVKSGEFQQLNDIAGAGINDAFRQTGTTIARTGRTDSFALPEQPTDTVSELAVFSFFDAIDQHAQIVAGAWPQPGKDRSEAAVSESTAALLGLSIGQELDLPSRRERGFTARIRVVGIYRINAADDAYWFDDPLEREGLVVGESFNTYGPFVVAPPTFFSELTPVTSEVTWRVYPDFDALTVSNVPILRGNVEGLQDRLNGAIGTRDRYAVTTELDDILRAAERSLLVTRTGVMILTVQLAILAGYALVLTAGLLIEQRRVETALLRSRGAATSQVAAMALMEGILLAIPAGIAGPWLAAWSLRLLNVVGPLTAIDLDLNPTVTRGAYLLSFIAAVACVGTLALPAVLSARSFIDARSSRGRQVARGVAQRAGIDLALLVVAGLAYWQLRRYGAPITESVQGRLGLDPLLVAAPAFGLLAGAVVALRFIPLLARLLDRSVVGTKGLVPSLGAWQVSRRPVRYARSALLLMLALAIGLFAIAYTTTWTDSQEDQADYQVGADLRVSPDRRVGSSIPVMNLSQAYRQIPEVEHSMPVLRDLVQVSRNAGSAELLAIDATVAGDIVMFRPDLSSTSLQGLMQPLVEQRPTVPAITVPGEPQRLALDVQVTLDPPSADSPPEAVQSIAPSVAVVVQDARGLIYRIDGGGVAADSGPQRIEFELAHLTANAGVITAEYPLSLLAIEMRSRLPYDFGRTGRFDLLAISANSSTTGDDWTAIALDSGETGWLYRTSELGGVLTAPELEETTPASQGGVSFVFQTGAVLSDPQLPNTFSILPRGAGEVVTVPVLASERLLEETELSVGDRVEMDIGSDRRQVHIVGTFSSFPTIDPQDELILVVDLPTIAMLDFRSSSRIMLPEEWWLNIDDAASAHVVDSLDQGPYFSWRVGDRFERAETLRTDPVALGIIGALSLGFVAATLFASIGFIVSAAVSARERLTEFALLRALGLSPQQLSGWLSLENGLLVLISLVGGTVLGLAISLLVLPFVTLTQEATAVTPGIIVRIPWRSVLLLEVITIGALTAVVGILAVLLRRVGLGSVLRLGEE